MLKLSTRKKNEYSVFPEEVIEQVISKGNILGLGNRQQAIVTVLV